MKRFTDSINEVQDLKQSEILVICDVQAEFSDFIPEGFVDKLKKYSQNFQKVYQIWDSNKATGFTYVFKDDQENFEKNYGTSFSPRLKQLGKDLLVKYPDSKEGDVFKFNDDTFFIRIINNHNWFFVNKNLVNLFRKLKGQSVILVGGADQECLKDVKIAMQSFGVNAIYNHEYIYSAKTSDEQKTTYKEV